MKTENWICIASAIKGGAKCHKKPRETFWSLNCNRAAACCRTPLPGISLQLC